MSISSSNINWDALPQTRSFCPSGHSGSGSQLAPHLEAKLRRLPERASASVARYHGVEARPASDGTTSSPPLRTTARPLCPNIFPRGNSRAHVGPPGMSHVLNAPPITPPTNSTTSATKTAAWSWVSASASYPSFGARTSRFASSAYGVTFYSRSCCARRADQNMRLSERFPCPAPAGRRRCVAPGQNFQKMR